MMPLLAKARLLLDVLNRSEPGAENRLGARHVEAIMAPHVV